MLGRLTGLCLLAALSVGLGGCPQNPGGATQQSVLDRVRSSGTLRAAFINYPPSMIVDPNTKAKSGVMNDVLAAAARNMGLKLEYTEETTWATMIESVEAGRVDIVVSGIWPSSTRALRADFSRAIYFSPIYAYARASDTRFDNNLARINDPAIKIAAIDGELSSIVAGSDYPKASVMSLPQQTDISQLLLQLPSNKGDVTFVEPAVAAEYQAKNPDLVKRIPGVDPVRVFPNTYLFKKGATDLRDAVNIAIVELQNSGEIRRILKKYDPSGTSLIAVQTPVSP
jgi:ABC-type amino acid transport substrate-binding protein